MSIAATHGPGVRSQVAKVSKLANRCSRSSFTTPATEWPVATVMGLRRVGALVKSTPATARVTVAWVMAGTLRSAGHPACRG